MKKTTHQWRRPIYYFLGILLITIAVAVLCIGFGQGCAAEATIAQFEDLYTTIAVPGFDLVVTGRDFDMLLAGRESDLENYERYHDFIETLAQADNSPIKQISSPGLASAYIPELDPDNYTQHIEQDTPMDNNGWFAQPAPTGAPYSCAMLEVTLTEAPVLLTTRDGIDRYRMCGTVEQTVGLQKSYADPTGFSIVIWYEVPEEMEPDFSGLEVGTHCLVYSTQYEDSDWELRSWVAKELNIDLFEAFDPTCLKVRDYLTLNKYLYSDGTVEVVIPEQYITMFRRVIVTIRHTENQSQSALPTIVPLAGSAESFLSSPEGALWQKALDTMEVNNHAFPVIGVERLSNLVEFARGNARIVAGRDFTAEEMENGAKVCIISETVAAANGIEIGDAVRAHFYSYDYQVPYQSYLSSGSGTVNPSAYFYTSTTPFVEAPETYTVVGFYRQNNAWGSPEENFYSFTPNTIFVPIESVPSTMDFADQGFFYNIVLHNGAIPEFQQAAFEAGLDEGFSYYDGGYTLVADSVYDYRDLTQRAALVGTGIFAVLIMLFLLLYPGREGRTLHIMHKLGATRSQQMAHVIGSSLCVLLPGTVLGIICSSAAWNRVTKMLAEQIPDTVNPVLDWGQLCVIGLVQLLAVTLLTVLLAFVKTGRNFGKKELHL